MFLLFLWFFEVFLSLLFVLILKFLSLVFLGVFPPKFSKTRSIRSKNFKSCVFCVFFSFIIKFKNIFSLYFNWFFKNYKKNSDFYFKIFILSYLSFKFQNSNLFQKSYLFQNLILSYFKIKFKFSIFKFQTSNFKIQI